MRGKAFTLIELLLVLTVLAIIVGVSATDYGSTYRSMAMRKSADDMALLMRYAQSQAVLRREVYKFSFSNMLDSYRLSRAALDNEGNPKEFENIPERMGRTVKVPDGLIISPEKNAMFFYPDGTIERNRIIVSDNKRSRVVSSYEQRGYVSVFDDNKKP